MAYNYDQYRIYIGDTGAVYPLKYDNFITATEDRANEVETAREGAASLLINLQTYAKYSLAANIVGNGFKCTNMPVGTLGSQDYCTVSQAQGFAGAAGVTSITDLIPGGSLAANDVLVVATDGNSIVGRPTTYTKLTAPAPTATTAQYNKNYDMNLTADRVVNLPTGILGAVISFADIEGRAESGFSLTINPFSGQKIMNQIPAAEPLVVNTYPRCSFDLVYVDATFGWTISRFQR